MQWKPSCSMRTDGRPDRYEEASSHFLQFCDRAQKSTDNAQICIIKPNIAISAGDLAEAFGFFFSSSRPIPAK